MLCCWYFGGGVLSSIIIIAALSQRTNRTRCISTPPDAGLLPYQPHIPILPTHVLSYNQTVEGLRGIYTVRSG